jgi:hypothetical protein
MRIWAHEWLSPVHEVFVYIKHRMLVSMRLLQTGHDTKSASSINFFIFNIKRNANNKSTKQKRILTLRWLDACRLPGLLVPVLKAFKVWNCIKTLPQKSLSAKQNYVPSIPSHNGWDSNHIPLNRKQVLYCWAIHLMTLHSRIFCTMY